MQKTILITGSTDGIGREAAKMLASQGHRVLLHGRNPTKLERVEASLKALPGGGAIESYVADLSRKADIEALAGRVAEHHASLDVLINNAGVYQTNARPAQGKLDLRFAVNTVAPYLLTQRLLPLLSASSRVINVSSAAQAPVNLEALAGRVRVSEHAAYAQSKLALNMWTLHMARSLGDDGPAIVAVNPGSMLGTKMVKETFGVAGHSIEIGAKILTQAALSDEFGAASGQYFDNDSGRFAPSHPSGLDPQSCAAVVRAIDALLA